MWIVCDLSCQPHTLEACQMIELWDDTWQVVRDVQYLATKSKSGCSILPSTTHALKLSSHRLIHSILPKIFLELVVCTVWMSTIGWFTKILSLFHLLAHDLVEKPLNVACLIQHHMSIRSLSQLCINTRSYVLVIDMLVSCPCLCRARALEQDVNTNLGWRTLDTDQLDLAIDRQNCCQ